MPDKMTDNEIVKALRSWLEEIRKSRQAYLEKVNEEHYPSMRYEYLLSDTIHEINRLQAENVVLKDDLNYFKKACAENKVTALRQTIKTAKAEAYKEFAERLKENSIATFSFKGVVMVEDIDNLLKELVGEMTPANVVELKSEEGEK